MLYWCNKMKEFLDIAQICPSCRSSDIVKSNVYHGKRGDSQRYLCHGCKRTFHVKCPERLPEAQETPVFPHPNNPKNPISWPEYNQAQMKEKLLFLDILEDLCSKLPEEADGQPGRPKTGYREMVFCMAAKLYEGFSSRRVSSDLQIAMQRGHITKVPHFNTVLKYFNDPLVTPLLTDLIRLSALPLKDFETTFAVDASGLSSAFYSRWLDERVDHKRLHDWIKINVICGVKSNIITAIIVTDGTSHESPHFPELVRQTAEHFRVKEVTADKGYSGRANMEAAFDVGAIPYIAFKSNATGYSRGSSAWRKMFHYFHLHKEDFLQRYHQRSNVESTFSALKRKFSTKLMLKNEVGQLNEALAMVLCHNICVLIRESYENGISTEFDDAAHLFPRLHINSGKSSIRG